MLVNNLFNPLSSVFLDMNSQQLIMENGLEGWLLDKKHIELAPELKHFCQQESVKYILRYEIYSRELQRFLQLFPKAIPIKGMSLIPRLYKNPILRRVTDIDLYFPQDLSPLKLYFQAQGYEIHEEKWEANDFKLNASKVIDGVLVPFEIHQKLLWENDCDWKILEGPEGKTLAAEDELLYLSGHLAFQHTFLRVNWLFDIALLIQRQQHWDQSRLDFLLQKLNLKNSFSSCLWACQNFLAVSVPQNLQKYILRDKKNLLIQKTIKDHFLVQVHQHQVRYYLLKHLLKDSLTQAFNYDILWLKQKFKYEFKSKKN